MSTAISAFMAFTILSFVLGVCNRFVRDFFLPKRQNAALITWLISLGASVPLFEPVGLAVGIPQSHATSVGSLLLVVFLYAVYLLGDYATYREHVWPRRRWLN